MAKAYNRYINTYINNKEAGTSIKQIEADYKKLNNTIKKNLIPGTQEYIKETQKLAAMKAVLSEHANQVRGMSGAWDRAKTSVSNFGPAALAALGGTAVIAGIKNLGTKMFDLAGKIETVQRKAEIIFGDSLPKVDQAAKRNANAIGLTTSEYVNAAAEMQNFLEQLNIQKETAVDASIKLTDLSGALSDFSGGNVSAAQASEILQKAMLGQFRGLKEVGIALDEADVKARLAEKGQEKLTGTMLEQAKAAATLELILERSANAQALAATNADTLSEVWESIETTFRQAGENLAMKFLPAMKTALDFFKEFTEVPVSEKLREEQAELNTLVTAIITTNTNQKLRNDLIKDLQSKYPSFLKNMNEEKVSNAELSARLAEVNDEYERKIQLTVFEEDIAEQTKKSAELYRDLKDATNEYAEELRAVKKELDKRIGAGATNAYVLQKELEILNDVTLTEEERLKKLRELNGSLFLNNISQGINKVTAADKAYQESVAEGNEILAERNKLFQDSINPDNVDEIIPKIVDDAGNATEAVQKLQQELINVQKILNGQIPQGEPGLTPAGGTTEPAAREGLGGRTTGDGNLIPSFDDEARAKLQSQAGEIAGIYTNLSNTITDITTTRFENEQRMLDEAMAAEIRRVEQSKMNEESKQRAIANITEKYDKKKADIEKKAMRARKASMISMSIANAAMAIIQSLANTTLPFPASLAAPITIGGITGIQTGIIATSKFARGGATGPGNGRRDETGHYVAGIVHDNEYVAAKAVYQDPTYAPIFDILETAHRAKGLRGFATGGETSPGKKYANLAGMDAPQSPFRDEEMIGLLRALVANTSKRLVTVIDDTAAKTISDKQSKVASFEEINSLR